jgi:hydrogenase large subunit
MEPNNYNYSRKNHSLSDPLVREIAQKNAASLKPSDDPLSRLGGCLAFHCTADLNEKKVTETASMATLYRGYEALLPGRDLGQVGLVSSTASGICGGVHATASALCLEMALGLKPPPLGIVIRNLLLSCQYLNDNTMHLYILCGPDYSAQVIEKTNPEIWHKAQQAPAKQANKHGYRRISDIMRDLNKPDGKLYKKALQMIRIARQAYTIIGGKYPHSESIVPGGVSIEANREKVEAYIKTLAPFTQYTEHSAAIWDDIFDFMLAANPLYEEVGKTDASMLDFGQWDHHEYYDGSYLNCDKWGEKRWSTPGAIINGKLVTTALSRLNAGMEEFVDHSYYDCWVDGSDQHFNIKTDPLGNALSPHHPWNKKVIAMSHGNGNKVPGNAYSWGTSLTWERNSFEVGAYVRMYLTALAQKLPDSQFVNATGSGLQMRLPSQNGETVQVNWVIPKVWNAFERNRARACALAFNLAITMENSQIALKLIGEGETRVSVPMSTITEGKSLGVGLWGAGRGFLAHWAVLDGGRIDNYQISIPSRINASPRTPWGDLGPCEKAVLNTPIIESGFSDEKSFAGIDIQRAIQSFDPCMSCTTHILMADSDTVVNRVVDTSFPI